MASMIDASSSSSSSTTTASTVATTCSSGDDDVLMRKQVFSGTLRPATMTTTMRRKRKTAAEPVSFQSYTLTHVTNAASVDVAISYCVLTSPSGASTTISTSHVVTSLPESRVPTLCVEEQATEQPRSTLSRLSPWRRSKPVRVCFEAESVEDLEMWFCWIRRSLQPKSEFLPVTVSRQSASVADPYRGPALMTLREGCIIGIVQASTLNLLEVIRINVITAFGNEDEDTTLWLTVCPACRAGPAFLDVASETTRYACRYAFQPATEEIHHTLYGHLEDVCAHVCGRIWKIPERRTRLNGNGDDDDDDDGDDAEAAAAAATVGAATAAADGSVTNSRICAHSSLCLNGAWKLPLSHDLVSNIVAPVICDVWRDLALRAGYSAHTVQSWSDQFDAMLLLPAAAGEPPAITTSQEAIVFLREWQRTTENDGLHQLVRLMKALDLVYELNLLLWALYNERVQTRPDSPMQLRCRQAAHSVATSSSILGSDNDSQSNASGDGDDDDEDDTNSIESRLAALINMPSIPGDEVRFLHFTAATSPGPATNAAAAAAAAARTPPSAESSDLPPTPTIHSLDGGPADGRIHGDALGPVRRPTPETPRLPDDQDEEQEEGESSLPEPSSHLNRSQSPLGIENGHLLDPYRPHRSTSAAALGVLETNLAAQESLELGVVWSPRRQYSFGAGSSWLSYCAPTSPSSPPPPTTSLSSPPSPLSGQRMMEKGGVVSGLQLWSASGVASPLQVLRSTADAVQQESSRKGDDGSLSPLAPDGRHRKETSASLDDVVSEAEADEPHQPLSGSSISHDSRATWMANRAPRRTSPETRIPAAARLVVAAGDGGSAAATGSAGSVAARPPPPLPATPVSSPPSAAAGRARTAAAVRPAAVPASSSVTTEQCRVATATASPVAERLHFEIGFVDADRYPLSLGVPHTPLVTPITSESPLQSVSESSYNGGRPPPPAPVVRRRHSTGTSASYVSAAQIARYQTFRGRNAATAAVAGDGTSPSTTTNRAALRLPRPAAIRTSPPSAAYLEVTCNGPGENGGRSTAPVPSSTSSPSPPFFVDRREWSVIDAGSSDRSQASSFVNIPTTFVDIHTSQEFDDVFMQGDSQWGEAARSSPSQDVDTGLPQSSALHTEANDRCSPLSSPSPAVTTLENGAAAGVAAAAAAAATPAPVAGDAATLVSVDALPTLDLRASRRRPTQHSWLQLPSPGHRGPTLDRLPSKSMRQGTIHRLAQHVSEHHTNDWLLLAYELGFTFDEVVDMESGCTRVVERVYRMVQAWLERKSSDAGARRTLVTTLQDLNWQDSAEVLSDLLVRNCSIHYMSTSVTDIKGPQATGYRSPERSTQHYEELDE